MKLKKFSTYGLSLLLVISIVLSNNIIVHAMESSEIVQSNNDIDILTSEKLADMKYAPNQILVKVKANEAIDVNSDLCKEIGVKNIKKLTNFDGNSNKLSKSDEQNICLITLNKGDTKNVINAISALRKDRNIEYAEPDYISEVALTPNDYYYANGSQSYLNNISMPDAWNQTTGSSSIVIGIVDTGIDYNHPDLQNNIWHNPDETVANGIDDDGNGYIDDIYGWNFINDSNVPLDDHMHGTFCAGIVGAVGNNNIGISGIAWNIKLVALKVGNANGAVYNSSVVSAISYAIEENIPILNNSYGGYYFSKIVYEAIENYDGIFIAAAGNDNTENKTNGFPATYNLDNIISVAATSDDQKASFSNYGKYSVDIAAPGVNIISTTPNSTYSVANGTSASAPFVTGAAALILSLNSNYNSSQIKEAILKNCDLLPSLYDICLTGGRLNVNKALLNTNSGFAFNSISQTITQFVGNTNNLTIPTSIGGITVISIASNAFAYNNTLQTVTVPSSIEVIGDFAFSACTALTSINVDTNNMEYMSSDGVLLDKSGTTLLQFPIYKGGSYTIPPSITSFNKYAFMGNNGLTEITFSTTMSHIPDEMFAFCSSLENIVFPENVSSIGEYAFIQCTSLNSLLIPDSITSIGDLAFDQCAFICDLTINGDGLIINGCAFEGLSSLVNLTLSGSIDIGICAFALCDSLTTITIPYYINNTQIGEGAFLFCFSLNSATIAKNVSSIGSLAFSYCSSNIEISGCANSEAQTYASSESLTFNIIYNPIITVTTDITTLRNQHLDVFVSVDHGILLVDSHTFYSNGSYTFYASDIVGNNSSLFVTVSSIIPKGDVNFSGAITMIDALMTLQAANNQITLTVQQALAADVDSSGTVTTTDADLIVQYCSGQITAFPNP